MIHCEVIVENISKDVMRAISDKSVENLSNSLRAVVNNSSSMQIVSDVGSDVGLAFTIFDNSDGTLLDTNGVRFEMWLCAKDSTHIFKGFGAGRKGQVSFNISGLDRGFYKYTVALLDGFGGSKILCVNSYVVR